MVFKGTSRRTTSQGEGDESGFSGFGFEIEIGFCGWTIFGLHVLY